MAREPREPTIALLDPRADSMPVVASMAPRPDSLDGKTIGLFNNSKSKASALLRAVAGALGERFAVAEIKEYSKPSAARVASPELLDRIAKEVDIAILATGD